MKSIELRIAAQSSSVGHRDIPVGLTASYTFARGNCLLKSESNQHC